MMSGTPPVASSSQPSMAGRMGPKDGYTVTPLPQLDFAKVEELDVNIIKRTFPSFPLHRAILAGGEEPWKELPSFAQFLAWNNGDPLATWRPDADEVTKSGYGKPPAVVYALASVRARQRGDMPFS